MKKTALTLASLLVSSVAMAAPPTNNPIVTQLPSVPTVQVFNVNLNPSGNLHVHIKTQDPKIHVNVHVKNLF